MTVEPLLLIDLFIFQSLVCVKQNLSSEVFLFGK